MLPGYRMPGLIKYIYIYIIYMLTKHQAAVHVSCVVGMTTVWFLYLIPCPRRPPDCHHPSAVAHRCHFGRCQPCRQVCAKSYPCGHQCTQQCHSAVRMPVAEKVGRAGDSNRWFKINFSLIAGPGL